ncbi:MAG: polysaccharide deacetylase family protein [Candidatus Eremiobacteraeota bacterium]|nr:polysaccharide deacetylase family protein [Candidatus Eremiobacteraeota bacterium]
MKNKKRKIFVSIVVLFIASYGYSLFIKDLFPRLSRYTYNRHHLIISPDSGHSITGNPDIEQILKTAIFELPNEHNNPKVIALTFDDGPFPMYTPLLLNALKHKKVKATFFINGIHARRFPQLTLDIHNGGHEIGNHTFYHRDITGLSDKEIERELDMTDDAVYKIAGIHTFLFRPPGGNLHEASKKIVLKKGYTIVTYSINPGDWWQRDQEKLYSHIFSNSHSGGIILLHSGLIHTVRLMPTLIQEYRKKGYKFVTISELARMRGIEPEIRNFTSKEMRK